MASRPTTGSGAARLPGYAAFEARDDLKKYGDNGLLLFAAQLQLGFDDVDTFAANALTDGSNDKKCDLVAVVPDRGRLVVAQGFVSRTTKQEAPANKASDLNTGVSWLLSGAVDTLPDSLRSAAIEARSALQDGSIREMVIWYVHNLPESKNVLEELEQAAQTADSIIRREFPAASVDVSFDEIGQSRLEEEYQRTQAPILITDKFTFSIPGGFEIKGTGWSSYSTAISADQLRSLWRTHKSKIMSPNIRDYLGVVRKANNINNGIKGTATEQPENFAIFNNGITILVHDYQSIRMARQELYPYRSQARAS